MLIDKLKSHIPEQLFNDKTTLEVGFLDGVKYPDGEYVAEVAFKNEFGTSQIPSRPFFRNAIKKNKTKWLKSLEADINKNNDSALEKLGELIRGDIVKSITSLRTPPNSEQTILRKGSSNPLIDTGFMRASVSWTIKNKG